ncbi:hypothetical protein Tco_0275881 [Tanacetum coccineum]
MERRTHVQAGVRGILLWVRFSGSAITCENKYVMEIGTWGEDGASRRRAITDFIHSRPSSESVERALLTPAGTPINPTLRHTNHSRMLLTVWYVHPRTTLSGLLERNILSPPHMEQRLEHPALVSSPGRYTSPAALHHS